MKKCPFCAEEIQDAAIKCRYCGEFLDRSYRSAPKLKWYQSTGTIIIALMTIGPFALPIVWMHPKYKPVTKIIITVAVVLGTIYLSMLAADLYKETMKQYKDLGLDAYMR